MIPSTILSRYARSLAEVACEERIEQEVTRDLAVYGEIFNAVPALLEVFHSPAVPREAKGKVLGELMARYPVTNATSNFLRLLLQHNRIWFFAKIRELYQKFIDERKGIISARVTAAAPLSADELKKLEQRLAAITGRMVNLEMRTDSALIGGVVVRMGSTIYDGSVRTQLAQMKRRLAEM